MENDFIELTVYEWVRNKVNGQLEHIPVVKNLTKKEFEERVKKTQEYIDFVKKVNDKIDNNKKE